MNDSVRDASSARRRVIWVFFTQGAAGLLLMAWMTWYQRDQTVSILHRLGPNAPILVVLLVVFAFTLALLKFQLTSLIFVSLSMMAYMAMPPLLGTVLAAWLATLVAIASRLLAMRQIGPVKIAMDDPLPEYAKTFGLFGTYGLPVLLAGTIYDLLGGQHPPAAATPAAAAQIAVSGIVLIVANNLIMVRPARAYGYSYAKILRLDLFDTSIYVLTLPFVVVLTLSYGTLGWGAMAALAFSGIVANLVAHKLAVTRGTSHQQLQRLASLTNIGKTISLRYTTEQLLLTIYTECKSIVDSTLFSIALLDESTNELSFELDVRDGIILPKERLPVGEGLNSWVVLNHRPLLLRSTEEEKQLGIRAVADTKPTESWLGVPMIARDRVIGVIAVESYRRNAFNEDDMILLTAIANQAAVAIENAHLYKDLEGLTYALEQRVMDRTNELREANLRLRAADRSKNQFLANMSHELRTPLNSIIGFSSVLLENTRETLLPRYYKFLENIHTAGSHLLELINDILDLSKIEAGKMELRTDEFDVRETFAAVQRVMKGVASQANAPIVCTVEDDVPIVRLDEGRLKQILFNLISNAVKFSPSGGGVDVSARFIAASESPIGVDAVRIDVVDHGIGIPPDELKRIFHEFYQTEQGRRSRRGGTGLGLSLTKNFIELHHGKIEVESEVGKGSRFILYLPVNYDAAAQANAELLATATQS